MSIFEYDEEKHIRNEKAISYEEGHESGFKEGEEAGSKSGLEKGIKGTVEILRDLNHEESEIKTVIMEKYGLTEEQAVGYMQT